MLPLLLAARQELVGPGMRQRVLPHPGGVPPMPVPPLVCLMSSVSVPVNPLSCLCADNPAQLRRQLQAIVPELTLTQIPAAAAAAGAASDAAGSTAAAAASRAALPQRPVGVADRAAAEGLLDRMHKLQAAAGELLQEQSAAATCARVAADFRHLLPEAEAVGRSIVLAPGSKQAAESARQQVRKQQTAAGPSAAAAARLAKLAQLRAAGSELAAALA